MSQDVAEVAAGHGPPVGGPPAIADFQIVPLQGLPVVGVVLIGLVVVIATDVRWGVDFFHVVGGAFWTALDLFLGFVLGPILGRLSIPARVELTTRLMPKMLLDRKSVV